MPPRCHPISRILFLLLGLACLSPAGAREPGPLDSIEVVPDFAELELGMTQTFTAIARDDQGQAIPMIQPMVTGTGGDITIHRDSPRDTLAILVEYFALQTGDHYFEIWDAAATPPPGEPGGIWGSADLSNIPAGPPRLDGVHLNPAQVTLDPGQSQTFTVTGQDQFGDDFDDFAVAWSDSGGTLDLTGDKTATYTAGNEPGDYFVAATAQGTALSDSAAVQITPPPPQLESVHLSPAQVTLDPGQSQTFTVTGKDQFGGDFDDFAVAWSDSGGTLDLTGDKTATYTAGNEPGDYFVAATAQGTALSDSAAVVIAPPDNQAPGAPALVRPAQGESGLGTSVTFGWMESLDPDGDEVDYELYCCEDENFDGCDPRGTWSTFQAGWPAAGLLALLVAAGLFLRRRGVAPLIVLILIVILGLLLACSGGSTGPGDEDENITRTLGGLDPGTTYYWKVVADDGRGGRTESATRAFSTE